MDEIRERGRPGHWGRGDRVQIGDDGCGVGVNAGASGQSGKCGFRVDLEEAGLEVRAVQEVDGLELNVDTELSTEGATLLEDARHTSCMGKDTHTAISATAAQTEWPKV